MPGFGIWFGKTDKVALGHQYRLKWSLRAPLILLACFAMAACGPAKDTHVGQPGTKRKLVFKQMLRNFEPMGLMLRGRKPYEKDRFLRYAVELQTLSTQPWQYFTPGSNYSPTRAKSEVWQKPAQFKQAQQVFIAASAQLADSAKTGDMDVIRASYGKVADSCKACHRDFRGGPH
ncbi:MAG: c-type cytochrome [Sulfuriferula sp.]